MCALIEPEIDDRTAAGVPHHLRDGLGGEEVVPDVDRDPVVPQGLVHLGDLVPVVVGRVVDQHADRAELLGRSGDRRLQGRHVPYVALDEEGVGALVSQRPLEGFATVGVDVDEADARALAASWLTNSAPRPEAPPLTNAVRPRRLGYVANTGCSLE